MLCGVSFANKDPFASLNKPHLMPFRLPASTSGHGPIKQSDDDDVTEPTPSLFRRFFRRSDDNASAPRSSGTPTSKGRVEKASRNSDITKPRFIDARYLNTLLKGKLKGKGQLIIDTAKANGIDPVFFASAMAFETGWGTSRKIRNQNNPGGLTGGSKGRYISFKTIDEGIIAMGARFKSRYVGRGLTTVASIAKVYAPVGARNDPRGTNGQWPGTVSSIMNRLIQGSVAI